MADREIELRYLALAYLGIEKWESLSKTKLA